MYSQSHPADTKSVLIEPWTRFSLSHLTMRQMADSIPSHANNLVPQVVCSSRQASHQNLSSAGFNFNSFLRKDPSINGAWWLKAGHLYRVGNASRWWQLFGSSRMLVWFAISYIVEQQSRLPNGTPQLFHKEVVQRQHSLWLLGLLIAQVTLSLQETK